MSRRSSETVKAMLLLARRRAPISIDTYCTESVVDTRDIATFYASEQCYLRRQQSVDHEVKRQLSIA